MKLNDPIGDDMKNLLVTSILVLIGFIVLIALSSCSVVGRPQGNAIDLNSVLIKATSTVELEIGGVERGSLASDVQERAIVNPQSEATANISMNVVDNASATMTLAAFTNPGAQTPTAATTTISFGNISVATLFDNDLDHCTANANNHCDTAGFAAFMQIQAGLLNSLDASQVMPVLLSGPLTAFTALATSSPGLFLQSMAIPATQHTVQFSNFSPAPVFPVEGNFSNVGAGTYAGVLTVVYFIAN